MFGCTGISRKSIITHLNDIPTPDLDTFLSVASTPGVCVDGDRIPVRFYDLDDINKEKVGLVQVDRRWHSFRVAERNGI